MSERDLLTDATAAVSRLMNEAFNSESGPHELRAEDSARAALESAGLLLSIDQPRPRPNHFPSCHDLLDERMQYLGASLGRENGPAVALLRSWNVDRKRIGVVKYGLPLQPFNGREPLTDGVLEGLDFLVYIEQRCYEQLAADYPCEHMRELQGQAFGALVSIVRTMIDESIVEAPR